MNQLHTFRVLGQEVSREDVINLWGNVARLKVKVRNYRQVVRAQQKAIDDRNRRIANLEAQVASLLNKQMDMAAQQTNPPMDTPDGFAMDITDGFEIDWIGQKLDRAEVMEFSPTSR